ncbi:MAG: hypothetical protein F4X97_06325 [Boseongicola sp. SB0662_bin_57]|nr:hypothetical protein [Boseongicola sp. SB0662_bin_57]
MFEHNVTSWISLSLMFCILIFALGSLARVGVLTGGKGIGWQFIRYTVLALTLPIVALLSINGKIDSQATATLIGTALGYVFGQANTSKPCADKTNPP